MPKLTSTKKLTGTRVVDAKRGKRIGKVRYFVFHPSEKRCIGLTVKRPDAALMFHRKDLFVALDGFHLEDGQLVVRGDTNASGREAVKALGVNWEKCVIWVGMPVLAQSGDALGYVGSVDFDAETGEVHSITTENGATNDAILGRRVIPGSYVKGFRRGQGAALAPMGEYHGEEEGDDLERGAILVSDKALDVPVHGGAAEAAGKATAVVADKAKRGAAKAKQSASQQMEKAKPAAQKAAKATGEAVEAGSFALGKQLGRATGMFSAFKDEFDKASKGEDD